MRTFGLAIAWNWEFDADFIFGIERECASRGITTYRIDPHNLEPTLHHLRMNTLSFRSFFDRASDADPAFLSLVNLIKHRTTHVINPHEKVVHAIDKATMHIELIRHGVQVPDSIIISPYNEIGYADISISELDRIGVPFVIKPANTTGGGTGVVVNSQTLADITEARRQHRDDKYLVQQTIIPDLLGGKRAWFRAYWVFAEVIICWWDDITHMYTELSEEDEQHYGLRGMRNIMQTIQRACKLDFFSSEIAMTAERNFIVVDYVNEVCDMRLKSKHGTGAPDPVVHHIEGLFANEVERHLLNYHVGAS